MIQGLSTTFQGELKVKTDALDVAQGHLRVATRELADQRRQIREWTDKVQSLEKVRLRTKNVERAVAEEDNWDWNDGLLSGGKSVNPNPNPNSPGKSTSNGGDISLAFDPDPDPPLPTISSSVEGTSSLVRLKRMKQWYERTQKALEDRIDGIKGSSADKELQCRKVVALCTGVELDQVDAVSSPLPAFNPREGYLVIFDGLLNARPCRCWKTWSLPWKAMDNW